MGLGSCARHGWGEQTWSLWAPRPLSALSLVPQASLASPLTAEPACLCTSLLSQLRHWEPYSWRLLNWSCRPVQRPGHAHCAHQCCSPFHMLHPRFYLLQHYTAATAAPQLVAELYYTACISALWLARQGFQPTLRSGLGTATCRFEGRG
jgi:hypothetical protein